MLYNPCKDIFVLLSNVDDQAWPVTKELILLESMASNLNYFHPILSYPIWRSKSREILKIVHPTSNLVFSKYVWEEKKSDRSQKNVFVFTWILLPPWAIKERWIQAHSDDHTLFFSHKRIYFFYYDFADVVYGTLSLLTFTVTWQPHVELHSKMNIPHINQCVLKRSRIQSR